MAIYLINSGQGEKNLEHLSRAKRAAIALKFSATGPHPWHSRLLMLLIATEQDVFFVDLSRLGMPNQLASLLHGNRLQKVFWYAKPVVKQLLHHFDLDIRNIFCLSLAVRLLGIGNAGETRRWTERLDASRERVEVTAAGGWSDPNEARVSQAAAEVREMLSLQAEAEEKLSALKLRKTARLEFRTVVPVAAMELKGIFADRHQLRELIAELETQCAELEAQVLRHLHGPQSLPGIETLNLQSPDQVKEALAEAGIQVRDTSESSLRPLVAEFPFIGAFLEYRHQSKLLSFARQQLDEFISPQTGRIHADYHQIASASGRFACSNPNMQQVPREAAIRHCIKPEPGFLYLVADYSQIELRVTAGFSRDPLMLKAYREGRDLHVLTAALTMDKPEEKVTKAQRQAAKAINFGLIYAMGADGLRRSARGSYGVEMSPEEARRFRERFFNNYRGVNQWQEKLRAEADERGFIRTAAGRIRSYMNESPRLAEVLNFPVQGTAAEGLKSAICIFWDRVREHGLEAWVVALIHDEIVVEVREEHADMALKLLKESMIEGVAWLVPNVPLAVEASIGKSWADK